MVIAWGWERHKKRYIHLRSAGLKPGSITYTTENGITVYKKKNCTKCDGLCKCSTGKRAMGKERRGNPVLVAYLGKYNGGKSM